MIHARALLILAVSSVLSCSGSACGGGGEATGGGAIPEVVTALARGGSEAEPFSGWSVPGVTLYRISISMDDRSESSVVGVDDASGELLRGPDLMRRMGDLLPEELAVRAFAVLLGKQGASPVLPTDTHPGSVTAQQWAIVAAPAENAGAVIFYGYRGEMSPELVRHRVPLDTFVVVTRTVTELLVARGEVVPMGGPICEPLRSCNCWNGCARFQLVRVPERNPDQAVWRREDAEPATLFVRDPDGALRLETEACTESCPPTAAPYRCELHPDRCQQLAAGR